MIPFVQTRTGLNVYCEGKMYPISNDHVNYSKIQEICSDTASTSDQIKNLLDVRDTLKEQSFGKVTIKDDNLYFEGRKMHPVLSERVIKLLKEEGSVDMFVKFMENLMLNPSYRSVEELYGFLDACSLPITSDGCFLAYKKVRYDYGSLHCTPEGEHMDNSLGEVVKMKRNEVDENSEKTCSTGLHCASFSYMGCYGSIGTTDMDDRLIIVKVNPKDVVSIPKDYDNQKMRVCEYLVIDELPNDGITELMKWACKGREVAYIRDTLATVKELAVASFGLKEAPKVNEDVFCFANTLLEKRGFIQTVIDTFGLQATSVDTFMDEFTTRGRARLTIQNLLQYVSNHSL